jgi:hypothetical protein
MTLIVGLRDSTGYVVACDSLTQSGGEMRTVDATQKSLHVPDRLALAICGDMGPAQTFLRRVLSEHSKWEVCADAYDVGDILEETLEDIEGDFGAILAIKSGLYHLDGDGCVSTTTQYPIADGTGAPYFLGAYHALHPSLDGGQRLDYIFDVVYRISPATMQGPTRIMRVSR